MSKTMLVLLVLGAAACTAAAGTVEMRDGRKFVGEVSREAGKVRVKMAVGIVEVDEKDVANLDALGGQAATAPADADRPEGAAISTVVWDESQVVLPEPMLLMYGRRLDLLADVTNPEGLQRQVTQWRVAVHDGKRKVGMDWIGPDDQLRRREDFVKLVKDADGDARKSRYLTTRTPAEKTEKARREEESKQAFYNAVTRWPDTQTREFLTAVLDLQYDNPQSAELRFRRCVSQNPLVAAYHQGRGLALTAMKQPLRALAEYAACLELRDDTAMTLQLVTDGLKEVPGKDLEDPVCRRARELLDRYEKPKYAYRPPSGGLVWLMPGKEWQTRSDSLVIPPYDRIVARQALGVPVAESALLVDADAIAGADLIYVEYAPGRVARAEAGSRTSLTTRGGAQFPVTAILVRGVTFTLAAVDKPAELKEDGQATVRAVNLYREMGTEIRAGQSKMLAAEEGKPARLEKPLLPGECVGLVAVKGRFAGLVTARTDLEAKDFGESTLVSPADLADWMEKQKGSLTRKSDRPGGGLAMKADAPAVSAGGTAFLVHVLLGEKPPTKSAK